MASKLLIASYTDSIVTVQFDPENRSLSVLSSLKVGHHPSWISRHPSDRSRFFTGLEQSDGRLLSLKYDTHSGKGEVFDEVSSGGRDPCTILVTDEDILVGNYSSGTVGIFHSPKESTSTLLERQPPLQFTGSGPNPDRQESSHPHQVYLLESSIKEVLVPDLGANKTWRLFRTEDGTWVKKAEIVYAEHPAGGPRHVGVYDGILYTLLELTSELTAHSLPPLAEGLKQLPAKLLASSSTLVTPPSSPSIPMLAAELLIPPPNASFPTPYIYVSNRNDPHPEGDTIAIFSTYSPESLPNGTLNGLHDGLPNGDTHPKTKGVGELKLLNEVRTGLNHLRGMIFFGPDDRYLIAGGAVDGGVKVFERVDDGASLRELAHLPTSEVGNLHPTGFAIL